MINLSRSIKIRAPIRRVLDCLVGRQNPIQGFFNLAELENIQQTAAGTCLPDDRMHGTPGPHPADEPDLDDQSLSGRLVTRSCNGVNSTITWVLYREGRATQVMLKLQYQLPASLLKIRTEQDLRHRLVRSIDAVLRKLKSQVELDEASAEEPAVSADSPRPRWRNPSALGNGKGAATYRLN